MRNALNKDQKVTVKTTIFNKEGEKIAETESSNLIRKTLLLK